MSAAGWHSGAACLIGARTLIRLILLYETCRRRTSASGMAGARMRPAPARNA